MPNLPDDIYTEPEDFSPDTLANLGPLRPLAGEWQSDGGVDIAPKAAGPERRVYREHIRMEPIELQAVGDTSFVLGSAVKHDHPLVLGMYSVHTSPEALERGEARIREIGRELRAQGRI